MDRVFFATSNDHKFLEAKTVLSEFGIFPGRLRAKGKEIQSDDVSMIAAGAAVESYRRHRRKLFTEDTGLFVEPLKGFPGAYASHALTTIGLGGLITLMAGRRDRRAEFVSAVAFASGPGKPRIFVGRLRGSISTKVAGSGGFGFDPVFIPEGEGRTLAELSLREKCAISHRAIAMKALGRWLTSTFGE
ncbi:MAG: non-canonical purine NTP pyrophosphatase [Nitrososphaerota archaeon]|nr:non-canonical purine NTP pyrophosphatase [Nitrososphaerota archaeon]